ncbi:hypothetical protein Tcan_06637 [Toxocara canis]|uniref:Uncharacterized protein n=1 Tax=Toxocara canis TaxID=6265 RepID=A0A0B2UZ52_TOXCA|nr:hypothetical protein Tcan_06637 [Toxocara canis]
MVNNVTIFVTLLVTIFAVVSCQPIQFRLMEGSEPIQLTLYRTHKRSDSPATKREADALWATKLVRAFDMRQFGNSLQPRISRSCYFSPVQCFLPSIDKKFADELLKSDFSWHQRGNLNTPMFQ